MNLPEPPLEPAVFRAVCAYPVAVTHLIPPDDVIRLAAGRRSREPFLIPRDRISVFATGTGGLLD